MGEVPDINKRSRVKVAAADQSHGAQVEASVKGRGCLLAFLCSAVAFYMGGTDATASRVW